MKRNDPEYLITLAIRCMRRGIPLSLILVAKLTDLGINIQELDRKYG